MIPQIIGLSGYAQAGKDTVGKILHDLYGYERIAFADKLKALALASDPNIGLVWKEGGQELQEPPLSTLQECVDWHGWEGAKRLPSVRKYLQNLGVAAREVFDMNFWVDQAFAGMADHPVGTRFVITDVRFPNEFEAIKDRGGKMWRVDRPGVEPPNQHISETALLQYAYDWNAYNDGTLYDLATKVMRHVSPGDPRLPSPELMRILT